MAQNKIHISASIILDKAKRILLVRKCGTEFFMQPGGKVEPGESIEECVCREMEEELGRRYDQELLSYIGQHTCQAANEPNTQLIADLFVIFDSFEPSISREIDKAVWIPLDGQTQILLAPLTRDIVFPLARDLSMGIKAPISPAVKSHTIREI